MQNPHIIISDSKRCLCGTYNLGGVHTPLACDDIHKAAAKLANQGIAEGLLLAVVLRELIEERD